VNVFAKDMATGKEQTITISGSSGLSKDEVTRMVNEAEKHAAEDQARRELIETRNQADALAYSAEKSLSASRDRVGADVAAPLESAIAAVRDAVGRDDLPGIRRATEDLQKASHALAEALYKQRQTSPNVKEGEVVDGETVGVN
jgi:molecular chaperone DnaK